MTLEKQPSFTLGQTNQARNILNATRKNFGYSLSGSFIADVLLINMPELNTIDKAYALGEKVK